MHGPKLNHRWFHLTSGRFFAGLLVVQIFLLLSERLQWFDFNEKKGWTVLIAAGIAGLAVVVMLLWGLICLVLRRRFQFGFRSLLVFVVVLSVPLGWFAWEIEKARRQREAVKAIMKAGAFVVYDYESDETGYRWYSRKPTTPKWLRRVLGDEFFHEVVVALCLYTEFDDDDSRHLRQLAHLKQLILVGTQITDNGLAQLKGNTELVRLDLDNTQIADNGLAYLEGMTNLVSLSLNDTLITDDGLGHLKGMTKLKYLSLSGTQITDNGLVNLEGMTTLDSLFLCRTQVTDDGYERLYDALPCSIHY